MNIEESIDSRRALLALAGAVESPSVLDSAFKAFLLLEALPQLYEAVGVGNPLEEGTLLTLCEDFGYPYPPSAMRELWLSTGLVYKNGHDQLCLRGELRLSELYSVPETLRDLKVTVAELISFASPHRGQGPASALSVDACLAATFRAKEWVGGVARSAIRRQSPTLCGVPSFWLCSEAEATPVTPLGGSFSTIEALLVLCDESRFGMKLDPAFWDSGTRDAGDLLDLILDLQDTSDGWTLGAFVLRGEDDDFVNAFDAQAGDETACPTVDVSATALRALCLLREKANGHPQLYRSVTERDARLKESVERATRFILRMQNENGAWGILRYPKDSSVVPPREPSCKMAVEGIARAAATTDIPVGLAEEIREAVNRYVTWAGERAKVIDSDACFWNPYFEDTGDEGERLGSTMWICYSLLAIVKAWPVDCSEARSLFEAGMRYLLARWSPNPGSFTSVAFRVPTWRGLSPNDQFRWEIPTDPFVAALALEAWTTLDVAPDDVAWAGVTQALTEALGSEHKGHWHDFLLYENKGILAAMPANTLHYCQLSWSYIAYLNRRLIPLFATDS